MLWIKMLHISFMVTWFAGLFYLPRLFVYHAVTTDTLGHERFLVMEKKLFILMTIGAALTIIFGSWLWLGYGISGSWLHAKLALVVALILYHGQCYRELLAFRKSNNPHNHVYFRWFNEFPTIIMFLVIGLAVFKPTF
ncbi:MAG TPA: TIGR00701 family protein [Gammaproteobacteria bacterium]|nr:TIGR00701 family protein [Gammaproteobacteria bacterium]